MYNEMCYVLEKPAESHNGSVSILTEHFSYACSGAVIQDYLCTNSFTSKADILRYEPRRDNGYPHLGTYQRKKLIFWTKRAAKSYLNRHIKNADDYHIIRIKNLPINKHANNRQTV